MVNVHSLKNQVNHSVDDRLSIYYIDHASLLISQNELVTIGCHYCAQKCQHLLWHIVNIFQSKLYADVAMMNEVGGSYILQACRQPI